MGIVASVLKAFHGGVHPQENKALSEHCAIETLPMPKRLFVPLHQHIGLPCEPCVVPGQRVSKGELIGKAQGFVSAPVHAPTSGTVISIEEHVSGHPSGLPMMCVVLDPDGKDQWLKTLQGLEKPLEASPEEIRAKIREAGIVGLGGASFPSFIKMSPPTGKVAQLLLINGVECEPYLTCDARLMEERARYIVAGIEIMMHALQAKECVIGIENNKPGAIRTMSNAVKKSPEIKVQALPVMYPQGAEKQLIEVVTGRQVPSGSLPIDVGVIVHNVATAVAIRDAVKLGRPLVSRVVTMTGRGIVKPANLECLVGTPIRHLIEYCGGLKMGVQKMILGGPMMGVATQTLDVPIVKGTSGILAMLREETVDLPEQPCIRCGHCLEVCPIRLVPCEMAWMAKNDQFETLSGINLFDCIECGSCSYVCPSHIPLVHYFRYGKLSILAEKREKKRMETDKERTKAKDERVEQEKAAKELKKAEMKAAMAAKKEAAALAKTEAEKRQSEKTVGEAPVPEALSVVPVVPEVLATASTEIDAGSASEEDAARAARVARARKASEAAKAARAARAATKASEAGGEQSTTVPPTHS